MPRLIDANAFIEAHCTDCKYRREKLCTDDDLICSTIWDLSEFPTVDAMDEVVRCKDCKYYTDIESRCDHPMQQSEWCYDCWVAMEPNDFCSCGERKDNERKAD